MKLYEPLDATALGPVRHACHSCGTCCTGWRVALPKEQDQANIIAQAVALGVPDPIVDDHGPSIRRDKGRCVFLREDLLCAIHARFGAEAKPRICQHFPRRSVRAEDGVRAGADPGCTSSWRTFADGPELEPWAITQPQEELIAPDLNAAERALVRLCLSPGMNVAFFAAVISGDHSGMPGLPRGLVGRMLLGLKSTLPLLEHVDNGPLLIKLIAPMAEFIKRVDPNAPPPWVPLPEQSNAFAFDLMGRQLFLRFGDHEVAPVARAMFVLAGILASAWVDPSPPVFGPALSAWARVCRGNGFYLLFMPNPDACRRMLHGLPPPILRPVSEP